MASSFANRSQIVRAAAILTNGEVKTTAFDFNQTDGATVTVRIQFTKGSLTNGIFKFYVSDDGVTWSTLEDGAGNVLRTLTADTDECVVLWAPGKKFLSIGVTGTGTVTSSTSTVTFAWLRRGSQR